MASAWLAARSERPEMLAVEQGLFFPACLSGGGTLAAHDGVALTLRSHA